jgi:hypothetical protein
MTACTRSTTEPGSTRDPISRRSLQLHEWAFGSDDPDRAVLEEARGRADRGDVSTRRVAVIRTDATHLRLRAAGRGPSADLLRQLDDDPLRATT